MEALLSVRVGLVCLAGRPRPVESLLLLLLARGTPFINLNDWEFVHQILENLIPPFSP